MADIKGNKVSTTAGKCKHDEKSCDHWKWCSYTKHEACASFKQKRKKSGSGVSCGKCRRKEEDNCKFICLRRDVVEGNVNVEIEEVD
jgi:hypothetical protein